MLILYAAMKYDYGNEARGFSYEHWNFYETLVNMGHEIIYFDFMALSQELGRKRTNQRLWEIVKQEQPDLLFSILFEDELDKETIRNISDETETTTLNWFADDHWRFDSYSRHWAPCFNWVVTTAETALTKYHAHGYHNVIKSQWGVNHHLYRKLDLPFKYDVTFIGQPHGNRRYIIDAIRNELVDIHAWGYGWENGRLGQEEMIGVFNQSKINLNLSNASTDRAPSRDSSIVRNTRKALSKILDKSTWGQEIKKWHRERMKVSHKDVIYPEQIKARNFEIPGCGGFQISGPAENLEEYFELGKEILVSSTITEMIDQIKYYLAHETERRTIADASHARVLAEHTYEERFREIFKHIGMEG